MKSCVKLNVLRNDILRVGDLSLTDVENLCFGKLLDRTATFSCLAVSSSLSSKSPWLSGPTDLFCPFGLIGRSVSHNALQTVTSLGSNVHGPYTSKVGIRLKAVLLLQRFLPHPTGSLSLPHLVLQIGHHVLPSWPNENPQTV